MLILFCAPACGLLLEEGREVVAEIGDEPIRLKDLIREVRALPFEERAKTNDPKASVRLKKRRQVLDGMINQRLMLKEADIYGIKVSDEEVIAALDKEIAQERSMENIVEGMGDAGANHEHRNVEYSKREIEDKRAELVIKRLAEIELPEEGSRKYYEDHIDEYRVRIPLVRYEIVGVEMPGDTAIIESVYKKAVQDKTTLADALASLKNVPHNIFSTTTPLTSLIHILPEMRTRLEKLSAGEVAEPFQMSANGREQYVVVRIIENSNVVPFENLKDQIQGSLFMNYLEGLREKYGVVIHDDMLDYKLG